MPFTGGHSQPIMNTEKDKRGSVPAVGQAEGHRGKGGQSWREDGGRLAQRVTGISLGGGVGAATAGLLPCLCGICDRRRRLCCIHPGVLSYKTQLSL